VHLKPAHLAVETAGERGNYKVRITSPVLARDVYLSFADLDATAADNYFDLLPGETREISVRSQAALDALKAKLSVLSLTDAFTHDPSAPTIEATK
ncbi:MAG: glycoside hydrolase family 2 protein, partial [Terracidiphilus sp.]